LFALLTVAFTLASVAHYNHRHDAPPGQTTTVQCQLCTTFDRLVDAPVLPALIAAADPGDGYAASAVVSLVESRVVLRPIPRGPPTC